MFKHIDTEGHESNYTVDEFHNLLDILRALSDETRQDILKVITSHDEICVNDIAKKFILSRPTISHHLNLMKRVKLLNLRKEGKEIYYSFNKAYVTGLLEALLNNLKNCC